MNVTNPAARLPRRLIGSFLLVLVVLAVGGGWFYLAQIENLRKEAEAHLSAIAQMKADQILQWRAERLGDASVLSENPLISGELARSIGDEKNGGGPGITAIMRSIQENYGYDAVLLVDPDGRIRTSLDGQAGMIGIEALEALTETFRTRRAVLTDLHLGPNDQTPHIDAIAPVFAPDGAGSEPIGAFVLQCEARRFLFPLIQSWPTYSWSAETLIVKSEGNYVLFLNELRFRENTALALRLPQNSTDLPSALAVRGREGIVRGKDYRGVKVMAYLKGIPGSTWFMIAKQDEAEVFAASRLRSVLILALILGFVMAVAGVFGMLWQRNEKARYRSLFQAESAWRAGEERYRITLMSVGDAVIVTDAQGTVELMNPVAEALTGWSREAGCGRALEEIFRIVNEETRKPVDNPVRRVVREGSTAGLANHTMLIDRHGKEHPIADSGAPIRDAGGRTVGVVLVFRDVSEEQRGNRERETTLKLLGLLNGQNGVHELIGGITGLLQQWTGCEAVGVRLREGDDFPYYETRGLPPEFVRSERNLCEYDLTGNPVRDAAGQPVLECMCGNILQGRIDAKLPFFTAKGSFWTNSTTDLLAGTTEEDRRTRTRNRCNKEGFESVALIRMQSGGDTLGLLQLNNRARGRFTPGLVSFLENAADQIAMALAQRRAQSALSESEEHYRSLFENMLNGFAYCRMLFENGRPVDYVYLEVNGAFESLTGMKDAVGKKVSELIPGFRESDPALLETYGRVSLTGVPERFETYVNALSMWFSVSVYCPGKEHFVAVFDVITERKRAEAGRMLLSTAIDQAGEMIVITDPDGTIQYVNPAFEAATGYSRQEAVGENPRFLQGGTHDAAFYKALWDTISGGETWKGRFVNKRKNGSLYTEEATISPVYDDAGNIANYVAAKHDCTNEMRLEAQLSQAQKMESVGRLAGGVAHDFNNMLQVILSYVEIAMNHAGPDGKLEKYLREIDRAARRSAELTGQLLAFARKQTIRPVTVDLNDAVAGTLKMLHRLIGEDIDLAWKPDANPAWIHIDPTQLDQILANLAVNARDAISGVGRLTIETGGHVFDAAYCAGHPGSIPGDFVMLGVSDDGCGMDRETVSHLFEPFFTTKPVGQGTGLGLATVYGIVKQNNGFINVYSEPGKGTTFRIHLPRVKDEAEIPSPEEATVPSGGTETILVVEDEAAVLELSMEMLRSLGYTVHAARLPEEAIRLAAGLAQPVHLLITDVVMPQMNGRDLAARLRTGMPGLKCLFMSGYTADVIAHQGMLEKDLHFLSKPFSMHALAGKVREVLGTPS